MWYNDLPTKERIRVWSEAFKKGTESMFHKDIGKINKATSVFKETLENGIINYRENNKNDSDD